MHVLKKSKGKGKMSKVSAENVSVRQKCKMIADSQKEKPVKGKSYGKKKSKSKKKADSKSK